MYEIVKSFLFSTLECINIIRMLGAVANRDTTEFFHEKTRENKIQRTKYILESNICSVM